AATTTRQLDFGHPFWPHVGPALTWVARMRRVLVLWIAALLVACRGDDGGASIDAPAIDAPLLVDGAQGDAPASDGPATDAAATDAGGIDGTPTNPGPVDCRVEADCPVLSSCTVTAPGG